MAVVHFPSQRTGRKRDHLNARDNDMLWDLWAVRLARQRLCREGQLKTEQHDWPCRPHVTKTGGFAHIHPTMLSIPLVEHM